MAKTKRKYTRKQKSADPDNLNSIATHMLASANRVEALEGLYQKALKKVEKQGFHVTDLTEMYEQLEIKNDNFKEENRAFKKQYKALEKENTTFAKMKEKVSVQLDTANEKIIHLENMLADASAELETLRLEKDPAGKKAVYEEMERRYIREIEEMRAREADWGAEIERQGKIVISHESKLAQVRNENNSLLNNLNVVEENRDYWKRQSSANFEDAKAGQKRLEKVLKERHERNTEISLLKADVKNLKIGIERTKKEDAENPPLSVVQVQTDEGLFTAEAVGEVMAYIKGGFGNDDSPGVLKGWLTELVAEIERTATAYGELNEKHAFEAGSRSRLIGEYEKIDNDLALSRKLSEELRIKWTSEQKENIQLKKEYREVDAKNIDFHEETRILKEANTDLINKIGQLRRDKKTLIEHPIDYDPDVMGRIARLEAIVAAKFNE